MSYPNRDSLQEGHARLIHLALKMSKKTVIGDYAMMFNRRSEFLYQALTSLDCMAMRRSNYQEL